MNPEQSNALIEETSPYLLQHAHNPVDWVAWSSEALAQAEKEGKLVLISIGYAACHWCHVMEHECFEDEEVASVMNSRFINIKVDREERPDVDHIYMDALQMMTGSGGWPLNIVALSDGRPFWGATFVKKNNWMQVLTQLSDLYQDDPKKIEGYANNMAEGIQAINRIEINEGADRFNLQKMDAVVEEWSGYFDHKMGGYNRAPKFPMPVNLNFLLHYATVQNDDKIREYVNTSLIKMAWGGIFDAVGGGFSRYAVDTKWHVPHFEKMLYDNGQLVSLYSQAYAQTDNDLYRSAVEKTIAFVREELMSDNFGFYSSLDADSLNLDGQLEEGAFYVWKEEQLQSILGNQFEIFADYFNVNDYGYWEHENYVLIRNASEEHIAENHSISVEKLNDTINECLLILKRKRSNRDRPRLDDKILTSWNGLMLKGLVDAYRYLQKVEYRDLALKNAHFIIDHLQNEDGGLYHNHKNGRSTINGYLEDYASVTEAFIGLYEITFDETWLKRAKDLIEYCQKHFFDEQSGMFFFTSKEDDYLIRRTIETTDNVVPASNSIMAKNLFKLSKFYPDDEYEAIASKMIGNVRKNLKKNPQSHGNWLELALFMENSFFEVVLVGADFEERAEKLRSNYLPNTVLAGTKHESSLPLFQSRYVENETLIYVCQKGACQLPVHNLEEVLSQIRT